MTTVIRKIHPIISMLAALLCTIIFFGTDDDDGGRGKTATTTIHSQKNAKAAKKKRKGAARAPQNTPTSQKLLPSVRVISVRFDIRPFNTIESVWSVCVCAKRYSTVCVCVHEFAA